MGRRRKENKVATTTVSVSEESLERINSFKRIGETQHECIDRILSQFILVQQLREERDAWETEAITFKTKYYSKSNLAGTLQVRVEELEQVIREQNIAVTNS